jgi:type III secretory pathway component EscV
MINLLFRLFAIALLIIILLAKDMNIPKFVKHPILQLYMAVVVILVLLLIDNMTGFILGLCLLVIYFKIYNMELQNKNKNKGNDKTDTTTIKTESHMNNDNHHNKNDKLIKQRCPLDNYNEKFSQNNVNKTPEYDEKHAMQLEYTTPEHLLAAQNNIFDLQNYNKEILGVEKGIYDEKVYGSQGLNSTNVHYRGIDDSLNVLGSLHFAILENE